MVVSTLSSLLCLEREAFVVNLFVWDPEPAQAAQDSGHHSGRAADVDVAVADVRSKSSQGARIERIGWHIARTAPTHQVVDRGAAQAGQLVDLAFEDHVIWAAR